MKDKIIVYDFLYNNCLWFLIYIFQTLTVVFIQDNIKNLRKKQEHHMTFTLITITVAFLILQGFQCISRCFYLQDYGLVDGRETRSRYIAKSTYAVARLGLIIHASINCLLYCLTASMFKKELLKLSRQFTISSRSCRSSSLPLYSD